VTGEDQAAAARRLVLGVMLAVLDGRDEDVHQLLAGADRDTLAVAVGGVLLLAGAVLGEVPPERRAAVREHLADRAVTVAGWPQ
jgi:hypothetical protein